MAIDTADRRRAALLDQPLIFPDAPAEDAQDRAWQLLSYYSAEGAPPPAPVFGGGSIDDELDADFFGEGGGVVTADQLAGWHVALNGRTYLIDVTRYQSTILDSSTQQQDQGEEPGAQSLARDGFWTRPQVDWRYGAGQELFDAEGADRRRFFASKGFDPWTRGKLCLHPDTRKKFSTAAPNVTCFDVGGRVYVIDGQFLRFVNDPTVETWAPTSVDCDATIVDWTTDGNRIYLAFGGANPLKVVDVGGITDSTLGAETPDIVEYANGRLVGADGKLLYELSATGTKTDIYDDPRTGWAWTAVVGHPEAIFAAGTVNDLSEIYAITPSPTDTALTAPTFAGHLPRGETALALAQYAGLVVIGTTLGVRVATVSDRKLFIGELIEIPGGVRSFATFGRFCWFGWSNFDTSSTGLGRLDLSISTSEETFVPAYASDLLAEGTQGTSQGVAIHDGDVYFAVAGSGVWGAVPYRVTSAFLDSGRVRYGVLPDKIFTGVEVRHDPLAGQVAGAITFDNGTTRSLGSNNSPGSVVSELDDAQGAGLSASLRISAFRDINDPTRGPCIRSWALNALVRPKRVTEIILPIILKTKVESLGGVATPQNPLAEVRRLRGLASTSQLVVYQEGDDTQLVRVASVAIPEGGVRSWTDPQRDHIRWFQTLVLARLLTKET